MFENCSTIFLPLDERILNLYKGYVINDCALKDLKESDIYSESSTIEYIGEKSKKEFLFRIILMIPLLPIFIIISLATTIFKRYSQADKKFWSLFDSFCRIFFTKEKNIKVVRTKNAKYNHAIQEDIPGFLYHCKNNFASVYLYSYNTLSQSERLKVENLLNSGLISSYQTITKLSDLISFLDSNSIILSKALLVISNSFEITSNFLDFYTENNNVTNIVFWGSFAEFDSKHKSHHYDFNCYETLSAIKYEIKFYITSNIKSFLKSDIILFIEENYDAFLNDYIKDNLEKINERLSKRYMKLIYYPAFQSEYQKIEESVLNYFRYHIPILYSLSDKELLDAIEFVLQKTSQDLYSLIIKEIELPISRRPRLLRDVSVSSSLTDVRYTYCNIEYLTEFDLEIFFDYYIDQVHLPFPENAILLQKRKPPTPPAVYDVDWYFNSSLMNIGNELILKIRAIEAENKFVLLFDLFNFIFTALKHDDSEIVIKLKSLLNRNNFNDIEVVLSPLIIDVQYNIFLPYYGNKEVKMGILLKIVYLLFLHHPDGILLKELNNYKSELIEIYNNINTYKNQDIINAIDNLTDSTNPLINQICTNIKETFISILHEDIAKYYYIDGMEGKPKKISLPVNFIM